MIVIRWVARLDVRKGAVNSDTTPFENSRRATRPMASTQKSVAMTEWNSEFCRYAVVKLNDSFAQIHKCSRLLTTEQIWHRPNNVSNAIGNLVIHLAGNVRQWIAQGLDGRPFERDRDAEFSQRDPLPTEQIVCILDKRLQEACDIIARMSDVDLLKKREIQGYKVSGLSAVFHVVEHFSLHTGQIVYATKILTGKDIRVYDSSGYRTDGRLEDVP